MNNFKFMKIFSKLSVMAVLEKAHYDVYEDEQSGFLVADNKLVVVSVETKSSKERSGVSKRLLSKYQRVSKDRVDLSNDILIAFVRFPGKGYTDIDICVLALSRVKLLKKFNLCIESHDRYHCDFNIDSAYCLIRYSHSGEFFISKKEEV